MINGSIGHIIVAAAATVGLTVSAQAELICPAPPDNTSDVTFWNVSGRIANEDAIDQFSGMDCIADDRCLIVADEDHTVFEASIDRASRTLTIEDELELAPLAGQNEGESDFEAVSVLDRSFVFTGSHGLRRKKDKEHNGRFLELNRYGVRMSLHGRAYEGFAPVIAHHPLLARFWDQRLQRNGINIEGLAVRNGRLFFGFRAPVWTSGPRDSATEIDTAFVLEVSRHDIATNVATDSVLHEVAVDTGEAIRGMDEVSDGFILLTGDASPRHKKKHRIRVPPDSAAGAEFRLPVELPPRLLHWTPGTRSVRVLATLTPHVEEPSSEGDDGDVNKPESVFVLEETADSYTLLILSDKGPCGRPFEVTVSRP